jgi:type IV pilus assembly protein PilQ
MRRFGRTIGVLVLAAVWAPIQPVLAEEGADAVDTAAAIEPVQAPVDIVADAPQSPWLSVRDVRVEPAGASKRVVVQLTRAPQTVRQFSLPKPPRLVIDVAGPLKAGDSREARFAVDDAIVSGVRAARFKGRLRIVLDLKEDAPVLAVRPEGDGIVAELGQATAALDAPAAKATNPVTAASDPVSQPAAVEPVAIAPEAIEPTPEPVAVAAAEPSRRSRRHAAAAPPPVPDEVPLLLAAAKAIEPAPPSPPSSRARRDLLGDEKSFTGQRISLDFKDADIQNVLRVLADVSNMNIIATDDVKGKITLHLSEVPWDQALDLVLRTNRLEATQEGNVMRISTIGRLKEEREALRAAVDAERELEPLRIAYQRVNYARADEALIDKVKGVLSDRGSVTFDDRTNTIIVRDIQRGIVDAEQLIHELDVQSPQVLIEANIVEATEDFARGLGVQWGYNYNGGPSTGTPTGSNFPGSIGIGGSGLGLGSAPPGTGTSGVLPRVPFLADFPVPSNFGSGFGPGAGSALDLALGSLDGSSSLAARLTALEEEAKGKVISRPRVITMNNVAATIQSLTILRVKLPSTGTVINTGTGGVAGGSSTATEKINTGITLVVTPQVSSDGFVLMNIYAKSSQPDFSRAVDGIPNEISREANSNVLIKDGETVVLGGIFRHTGDDRESGLPYLRNVPGLGWLFKRTLDSKRQEELLVFITPKVVETGTAALPPAEHLWEQRRGG